MREGINRIDLLNPEPLLDDIDVETTDELVIRRSISAMYISLFNFWAAIEYYQNNRNGNGKGSRFTDDDFTQTCFEKSILTNGSKFIGYLSNYRNACDHRVNNPAKVNIFQNESSRSISLPIDNNALRRSLESFTNILEVLKNRVKEHHYKH